jgi:hypothetical protein
VETVAQDTFFCESAGEREEPGGAGHPAVEGGVDSRHLLHPRPQGVANGPDCRQRRGVVEWCELRKLLDGLPGPGVQEHTPGEARPPWTTRWPTASNPPRRPEESSNRIVWRVALPWSPTAAVCRRVSPFPTANSTVPWPPILSTIPRARDRSPSVASKSSNISVELPQVMVRILTD